MKSCRPVCICLVFLLSSCAVNGPTSQEKEKANQAVTSLMRIDSATNQNVSLGQYESLLNEARQSVSQASAVLHDEELKKEFDEAVEAYSDQGEVWKEGLENNRIIPGSPTSTKLQQKYSFKLQNFTDDLDKGREIADALKAVRKVAHEHVKRAQQLAFKDRLLAELASSMDTPGLEPTPEPSPRNVEYRDAIKFVNWGQIIAVEGYIDPAYMPYTSFECDDTYCHLRLCPRSRPQCAVYSGPIPAHYFDFPYLRIPKSIMEPLPKRPLRPEDIRYHTVEGKIVNYRDLITITGKVDYGTIYVRQIKLR